MQAINPNTHNLYKLVLYWTEKLGLLKSHPACDTFTYRCL